MCGPICAIGIASGLGISSWLGINDITLGLWIGALILSLSIQFNIFLAKKLSFLPILINLDKYTSCIICGFPEVICGSILGILTLFLVDKLNLFIIDKHNKKVYFYYQKVIIPVISLIIVSMIIEAMC